LPVAAAAGSCADVLKHMYHLIHLFLEFAHSDVPRGRRGRMGRPTRCRRRGGLLFGPCILRLRRGRCKWYNFVAHGCAQ
jgi:hypothetical protein